MAERHGDRSESGFLIAPRAKTPQTHQSADRHPFFRCQRKEKEDAKCVCGGESYFEGSTGVKERQRFDSLSSRERKIKRALPCTEMWQHSGKGRTLILKINVSAHTSLRNSHSKLSVVSQLQRPHLCL